jgi:hypothetical protein
MPPLPRAHMALVVALGLIFEATVQLALGIGGWQRIDQAPINLGMEFASRVSLVIILLPSILLLTGGISLLARWPLGWWLALATELTLLFGLIPGAIAFARLVRSAGPTGTETAWQPAMVAGFVLLFIANAGWKVLLVLGLGRADVRARVGLEQVEPWSSAARSAAGGALAFCAILWLRTRMGF